MGDWKLVLALLGGIAVILLDDEDRFYKLTHGNKINVFAVLKVVMVIALLIYSILLYLGKI